MSKITTGEMFAEWQAMNAKLNEQIEKQIEIIDKQQLVADKLSSSLSVSVGNFPTKQSVSDVDAKTELELIKNQQAQILARLDQPIPTQVTGSNTEFVRLSTAPRPQGKEGNSLFLYDTRQVLLHDGTDWREI